MRPSVACLWLAGVCPTWFGSTTIGKKCDPEGPPVCASASYVFATFVMTVVAQEDQSRVVRPRDTYGLASPLLPPSSLATRGGSAPSLAQALAR